MKSDLMITEFHYVLGGKKYDRVTSFTGMQKGEWLRKGRERGTAVHSHLEKVNTSGLSMMALRGVEASNPEVFKIVSQYIKWAPKNIVKVHWAEKPFFSDKLMVAGTPDLYADIMNGDKLIKNVLIDLKTGGFYKNYVLQFGGYRMILKENGIKPNAFASIVLSTENEPRIIWLDPGDVTLGEASWVGCMNHHRALASIKNYK